MRSLDRNTGHAGRFAKFVAVSAVAVVLTAGCSSSSSSNNNSGNKNGEPDPNGIVKVEGLLNEAGGAQFYPTTSSLTADEPWMNAIYGSLLQPTADGDIKPYLAKSYKVVDGKTIEFELRDGMKFSDGQAFDATAVRTSLLRNLNKPATPNVGSSRTPGFKALSDVVVDSPSKVTVKLSSPVAGLFVLAMTSPREGGISSPAEAAPTFPNVHPIGAGPFVLDKFEVNQYILMKKNPNFYDADNVKLGGIQWFQTAAGPTQTTGLLSNNLNVTRIPATDLSKVTANSTYATKTVTAENGWSSMLLCTTKAPLDNLKVRQAISLAINRDQLNQLWQGGLAQPQVGYWPSGSPQSDPALKDIVKYDPAKAKELLKEAGVTNLSVDMYYTTGYVTPQTVEILQAQLADVGIKLNIINSIDSVNDMILPQKPGILLNRSTRLVESQIAATTTGGLITLCGAQHPDIAALLAQAGEMSRTDPAAIQIYKQIDKLVADNVWMITLVTLPQHWAWNADVVGGTPAFNPMTGLLDYTSIYVKKK